MKRYSSKEIINLVSIISTIFGFILLLFYWNEFSILKKLLIFLFMLPFIYLILKNTFEKPKYHKSKYLTIDYGRPKRSGPSGERFSRVENFFGSMRESNEPNFYEENKSPWSRTLTYASEKMTKEESPESYKERYFDSRERKNEQLEDITRVRLFIPQNLTTLFEEIKEKVSPMQYYNKFYEFSNRLRSGNPNAPKTHISDYYHEASSLVLDSNKNLMLEKDYEMIIKDEKFCAEVISEFLEERLKETLNQIQTNFRRVSEMVMKIFGVKVNFYGNRKDTGDFDSRDITIAELREFLIRWRNDPYISQKFKLTIPIKEFSEKYYAQLYQLTEIVCQFLMFSDKNDEMAFRLYVKILNEEFRNEHIVITQNESSLSVEMRRERHIFLIHSTEHDVSFSYNRIKKFITTNPLVSVMAFFSEDFKINYNRTNEISKELKKFFKEKARISI